MKVCATRGIRQDADPADYARHHYGLPPDRWASLATGSFWITGAGTGYGRCIAIALASAGAMVFLTCRREHKLLDTLDHMRRLGVPTDNSHVIPADITSQPQIAGACRQVTELCDSLTGLVHCAALPGESGVSCPLASGSPEHWERMVATNVTGPWLLTRAIFPHMAAGNRARVLFLTSEAGWAFTPGHGPYNISKAAVNSLGGSMAAEYSASYPDMDIQINILSPGEARTEMNADSSDSPYKVVSMTLVLLSHPPGGPNGKYFHRDGRHLAFGFAEAYGRRLI